MNDLTDELKIINSCIIFASKNSLDYQILRCPNISGGKRIEIDIGKGNLHNIPTRHYGASFGTKENGNLKYRQIHVYPLNDNQIKKTEQFRLHLEKEFPDIESKW